MDSSDTPSIPNFEILGRIGGGAYGEVYLARSVTGMYRAVKTVHREDFEYQKTFEREFEGIQRYEQVSHEHPGLVDVLHVGRDDDAGFYYYVMELADDESDDSGKIDPRTYRARTLSSVLKEGNSRSVEQCVHWGLSLVGGLGHLHEAGLTHRDVKPSNIIFVKGVPKLADVGLVAQSGQRTYVGTEGYVPPEGPGASSADLYALAMVLYELHTGKDRLDFPELPTNMEIPATVNRDQWRAFNTVICRAGSPDIGKRYDSARSFALALRGVLGDDLPGGLSAGRTRPLGKILVVSALVALLLGGLGFGGYWLWSDYQSFLEENRPRFAGDGGSDELEIPDLPIHDPDAPEDDPTGGEGTEEAGGSGESATATTDSEGGGESDAGSAEVADAGGDGGTSDSGDADTGEGGSDDGVSGDGDAAAGDGTEETPVLVANVVTGEVKVSSRPSGASVWLEDEEIGRTETPPLELPVGPVELVFRHPDYLDTVYRGEIEEGFQQIAVELLEDRRPISGSRWINSLGMDFVPSEGGAPRTAEPVSSQAFSLFLEETGRSIPMNGFGGLAGVRDEQARWAFCDWVTRRDRATGYLGREQYHRPVVVEGGIADTFHCEVANEVGTLLLNSEPEGASVTVNGRVRGVTPVVLDNVRFGPFEVICALAGYEIETVTGVVDSVEPIALPVVLEPDDSAALDRAWENSLGMRLVPVGDLLVATLETSVRDYRRFVTEADAGMMPGAGFGQGLDHPVAGVTLPEARAFCEWLTAREKRLGLLRPGQRYRLPTDREWTRFTGQAEAPGETPEERGRSGPELYPWGEAWPPPPGTGNFADAGASADFGSYVIEGYEDGFPRTAPCGSFAPLGDGLFDLSGNVWEWVDEPFDRSGEFHVVRGGGWNAYDSRVLRTHYRNPVRPDARENHYGFRYVLADVGTRRVGSGN